MTLTALVTSGHLDVACLALIVALALAYAAGVRRARATFGSWPWPRTASFAAGLLVLAAVTLGGVGAYARRLFWVDTVQVCALLLVVPVLLAYGGPVALARTVVDGPRRRRLARLWHSSVARTLRSPLVGPLLVPVACAAVFFTPVLRWSLDSEPAAEVLHLAVVALGFLFALPLAASEATSSTALALGLFVGFLELLLDAVPGLAVRLRTHLLAGGYFAGVSPRWGLDALRDQQRGGAILWAVAELIDLPFIAVVVTQWMRRDELESRQVDRDLDARAAAERAAIPAADAHDHGPLRDRPWWEVDPSVLGEVRARQIRAAGRPRDDA